MGSIHRRTFIQGAAASAAALALAPLTGALQAAPRWPDAGFTEAALIALSRDPSGQPHIAQAALVDGRSVGGSLAISPHEIKTLRLAARTGDSARLQTGGLWVGGQRFVFIDAREDGQVLRGVRAGGFVTTRVIGDRLVVATGDAGMVLGRAVEAVYQLMRRPTA